MSTNRRLGLHRPLILAAAAGLAAATLTMPAAQASPRPAAHTTTAATLSSASSAQLLKQARQAKAHLALTRVQSLLAPKSHAAAQKQLHSNRDATMAFRSAWAQRGSMSAADRAAFDKANGRPVETNVKCSDVVCVHWTPSETKTSFALLALKTVTHVHKTYIQAGYRGPKPDGKLGGNKKTDVYMSQIGNQGLYGYCTTDQQNLSGPGRYDVWAYCVLDNNFSHKEFPTNTPVENLEVTSAHEYFHANQFAYDILDDRWFLEATATWAEDELYSKVNDNLQYLVDSPLVKPTDSLDNGANGNLGVYGRWIFFRYITEHFKAKKGILPKIMLQFWQAADSSRGPKHDQYSSQAINTVLKTKGTSLAKIFAQFSDANLRPAMTYSEGKANHYPSPDLSNATFKLSTTTQTTGKLGLKLNHLSAASAALVPDSSLSDPTWQLGITFDLGPTIRGSEVVVTTYLKNGKTTTKLVPLDATGAGTITTPFSTTNVTKVIATLVNASARFTGCGKYQNLGFSCSGKPTDQNILESFTASVFTPM